MKRRDAERSIVSKGFTIVELLIVIVVISVLVSLVVTSYRGIQQRSNNAARLDAAKKASNLIRAYIALHGSFGLPDTVEAVRYCLSDTTATDFNNDGTKECGKVWSSDEKATYDQTLINKLKTVSSALPNAPPNTSYPSTPHYGPILFYWHTWAIDGVSTPYILEYWLEGSNQQCVGGTPIIFVSPGVIEKSNLPYSEQDAKATYCYIALNTKI